ncbi:MAG: LPXTG cell wall anchor domain-containing protein [Cryobacterium sp.]|nr:LPXTG cell wall anchor domain-containing protein [Cryobacterium sp.]
MAISISGVVLGSVTAAVALPADALTTLVVKADGSPVLPGEIIDEGTTLKLRIQYQKRDAPDDLTGTSHTIEMGTTVTVGAVPSGNTAVTGIVPNTNGIDITFANPWPANVNQGYIELEFTVDDVVSSGEQDITWEVGGQSNSLSIVVRNGGDEFENIGSESFDKAVSPGDLNSFVDVGPDGTGEEVFLGLDSAVIGVPLSYTLTVELPAGSDGTGFSIADALPAGLSYLPSSFTSTLSTWDADGRNQQVTTLDATTTVPAAFAPTITPDGQSFTGSIDLPTPSILTVIYQATIADEASRLVVEAALQSAAGALGGDSGTFTHPLTNTAQFDGGNDQTATVNLQGSIPGPCTVDCSGAAFGKSASGGSVSVIADGTGLIVDEAGNPAPVGVSYTLSADLAQWDGHNSNYTLDRNVVISDTLVSQLTWNVADPDFITVTAGTGSPITGLTEVVCPVGTASDPIETATTAFNGDAYIGTYCVDGQRILINIGKSADTDVTIELKAQLHSVGGLSPSGSSSILGATRYALPNQAQFWHRNGARSNAEAPQYPVRLPDDRDDGLNDSAAFTKQGPTGSVVVNPGDVAYVPYTFTVHTDVAGISAEDARIEDQLDTSVFDVSDLSLITVTSSYSGVGDISGDVELSLVGDTLIFELADGVSLPAGGTWVVTALIPTYPLVGKQTLDITNYASLFGTGTEPVYWSENRSRSTSFGDELEVRKHVYDRGISDWTRVLVAPVDGDGELVEDVYVYRLQLIAHGSFAGAILPVSDLLPAEAEFLGFVDASDVASGAPVIPASLISLGHGIEAEFDGAVGPQGEITVYQASGSLPVGGEVAAYFAVRLDRDQPEAVVNSFGGEDASIVPGGPSIDIEKWSDEGAVPEYDTRGRLLNDGFSGDFDSSMGKALTANTPQTIHFTVSNDGPEALLDIEVSDRLDAGSGAITDLECVFPGATAPNGTVWAGPFLPGTQFECEGTLPGLQPGQSHANTASVTGVGMLSGIPVDDSDEWHGRVNLPATGAGDVSGLALFGGLVMAAGVAITLSRRRGELL